MTPKRILAAVFILLGGSVVGQDTTVLPQATTATYQDWTLRCDHLPEDPPRRVCEIVQAVRANDGQAVLAQLVLGRPAPDQPVKLIVQLPPGVWLPANVTLSAPGGASVSAHYTRCLNLCVAEADVEAAFIEALKAGTDHASLLFQDGGRRIIELPISLIGFTAAFNNAQQ